jgi:thioredoxin 1
MAEMEITKENFEAKVMKADKPVILDFWASWCGPCQWMAPVFEELSKEYDGKIVFGQVNVDEQRELASQFNVKGIPCLVILKDGKEVDRIVGFNPKESIAEALDKQL